MMPHSRFLKTGILRINFNDFSSKKCSNELLNFFAIYMLLLVTVPGATCCQTRVFECQRQRQASNSTEELGRDKILQAHNESEGFSDSDLLGNTDNYSVPSVLDETQENSEVVECTCRRDYSFQHRTTIIYVHLQGRF